MPDFNFNIRFRPRFSDLDAFRHVNNATYLTYCEEGRVAYCRRLGIFYSGGGATSFVIARAELEFKSPVVHGQELEVRVRTEGWTKHRFDFVYEIFNLATEKVALKARTRVVCWKVDEARPVRLPDEERRIMEEFEAGGASDD